MGALFFLGPFLASLTWIFVSAAVDEILLFDEVWREDLYAFADDRRVRNLLGELTSADSEAVLKSIAKIIEIGSNKQPSSISSQSIFAAHSPFQVAIHRLVGEPMSGHAKRGGTLMNFQRYTGQHSVKPGVDLSRNKDSLHFTRARSGNKYITRGTLYKKYHSNEVESSDFPTGGVCPEGTEIEHEPDGNEGGSLRLKYCVTSKLADGVTPITNLGGNAILIHVKSKYPMVRYLNEAQAIAMLSDPPRKLDKSSIDERKTFDEKAGKDPNSLKGAFLTNLSLIPFLRFFCGRAPDEAEVTIIILTDATQCSKISRDLEAGLTKPIQIHPKNVDGQPEASAGVDEEASIFDPADAEGNQMRRPKGSTHITKSRRKRRVKATRGKKKKKVFRST